MPTHYETIIDIVTYDATRTFSRCRFTERASDRVADRIETYANATETYELDENDLRTIFNSLACRIYMPRRVANFVIKTSRTPR